MEKHSNVLNPKRLKNMVIMVNILDKSNSQLTTYLMNNNSQYSDL
jgi:hypothetical protein